MFLAHSWLYTCSTKPRTRLGAPNPWGQADPPWPMAHSATEAGTKRGIKHGALTVRNGGATRENTGISPMNS